MLFYRAGLNEEIRKYAFEKYSMLNLNDDLNEAVLSKTVEIARECTACLSAANTDVLKGILWICAITNGHG
jgi:hypothetical protein